MRQNVTVFLILFANLTVILCGKLVSKVEPALLVVSFDAFRPDYLYRNITPNLDRFRQDGTTAAFMSNVFPTKTFVDHFSIATVSYRPNNQDFSVFFTYAQKTNLAILWFYFGKMSIDGRLK